MVRKIKWYVLKIRNMEWATFFKVLKEISVDTHRLRMVILGDMLICSLLYGAGYVDYYEYEFYLLNHKQRRTFLTIGINEQMVKRYNDEQHTYKFQDKGVFNNLFNQYLGRDWLNLEVSNKDDFKKFVKNKKRIIVKPNRECSGKGVKIIKINKTVNIDKLYGDLKRTQQCLVEEVLENHHDIKALYPKSLNTLRIISFRRDQEVYILVRVLKIGNGGILDNFATGGMYTFIDENGIVYADAIDKNGQTFNEHPITKVLIKGFKIPYFAEAITLVKEAAMLVPEVPYVGWDIAITERGPVIIEGNQTSGIFQLKASLNSEKVGALPVYNQAMQFYKHKKI